MKTLDQSRTQQHGVSLIEALIALVIMAVGILSIAKLNSFLIDVGGQAKARAQAVQLAEAKVEEWRSIIVNSSFNSVPSTCPPPVPPTVVGSETLTSVFAVGQSSAQFTRAWSIEKTCSLSDEVTGARVEVTVSWLDRASVTQSVTVSSLIAWDDPGMAAGLWKSESSPSGGYARVPTGRATLGAGTVAPPGSVGADGLTTLQGADNKWRLVNASGTVLLTASVANEAFSVIEGNVYIDQAALGSLTKSVIYVVISDASYCSMTPSNALTNLGGGSIYKYFSYKCYLGADWYGNIGVVRTDNANTNDRVCVGDPNVTEVSYASDSDSRHPGLSTRRTYRGYNAATNATGIGINESSNAYIAAHYNGHDFLLTRITGNPADADCRPKLRLYPAANSTANPNVPFGSDSTIATPGTGTADSSIPTGLGNPGKFFCLSADCPSPLPGGALPDITITLTGEVDLKPNGSKPDVTVSLAGGTCTNYGGGAGVVQKTGGDAGKYSCTLVLTGWTGSTWAADLTVTSSGYVCPIQTSGTTVSPVPGFPATPTSSSYVFALTSQSVTATSPVLNFRASSTTAGCN